MRNVIDEVTKAAKHRWILHLLLIGSLSGCSSWHAATGTPQEIFPPGAPTTVRLTLDNGEVITLADASLDAGVIEGLRRAFGVAPQRVALSSVRFIEQQSLDVLGTVIVTTGLVVAGVFLGIRLRDEVDAAR